MRWRAFAAAVVGLGFGLMLGGVPSVYAQSLEDQIQLLRKQMEDQQKRFDDQQKQMQMQLQTLQEAIQRQNQEAAQQQKAQEGNLRALKEQVESQPPAALVGTPPVPPSRFNLGLVAAVDFQFIQLSGIQVPFAALGAFTPTPPGTPVSIVTGGWQTIDQDREFTPRYTVGYYLPGGWGKVSTDFQYYSADNSRTFSVTAPGHLVPPTTGLAFFNGGGANPGGFDEADAKQIVRYYQWDAQWGRPIQLMRGFVVTPEVGIRALWWKDTTNADFRDLPARSFDGSHNVAARFEWRNRSTAVGPKIGLGARYDLPWVPGLTFGFTGSGGFMVGNWFGSNQTCRFPALPVRAAGRTNILGCGRVGFGDGNFTQNEGRGFPFTEGDFLLGYAFAPNSPLRGFTLGVGYRLGAFFDLTSRPRSIVSTAEDTATSLFERHNVIYDTPYLRLKYIF